MTLNRESARFRRGWVRSIRDDVLRRMALAPTHSDVSFERCESVSAPQRSPAKKKKEKKEKENNVIGSSPSAGVACANVQRYGTGEQNLKSFNAVHWGVLYVVQSTGRSPYMYVGTGHGHRTSIAARPSQAGMSPIPARHWFDARTCNRSRKMSVHAWR